MKKLLLPLLLILGACSTSKNSCEAYGKDNFLVVRYVFEYPNLHHHIKEQNKCVFFEADTSIYYDTIYKPELK
jgi:hypothetical protein